MGSEAAEFFDHRISILSEEPTLKELEHTSSEAARITPFKMQTENFQCDWKDEPQNIKAIRLEPAVAQTLGEKREIGKRLRRALNTWRNRVDAKFEETMSSSASQAMEFSEVVWT